MRLPLALALTTALSAVLVAKAALPQARAQATPAASKTTLEPGIVKGTVLDRNGKPMAGVIVAATVNVPRFYQTSGGDLIAKTDANGRYRISVRDFFGVPHVSVQTTAPYHGGTVPIPFRRLDASGRPLPDDTFEKNKGAIMNFVPAVSGLRQPDDDPKSWASYIGGCLVVSPATGTVPHDLPAGTKLRLVLTPTGPLLDGSPGHPITKEQAIEGTLFPFFNWFDIPLGVYTVQAFQVSPDGKAAQVGTIARIPVGFRKQVVPMSAESPLYWPPDMVGDAHGIAKFALVDLDIALP